MKKGNTSKGRWGRVGLPRSHRSFWEKRDDSVQREKNKQKNPAIPEKKRERERERKTDDDHTNVSMHHIFMHIYLSFISMHLDAFHSYTPHIEDRNIQLDILFV